MSYLTHQEFLEAIKQREDIDPAIISAFEKWIDWRDRLSGLKRYNQARRIADFIEITQTVLNTQFKIYEPSWTPWYMYEDGYNNYIADQEKRAKDSDSKYAGISWANVDKWRARLFDAEHACENYPLSQLHLEAYTILHDYGNLTPRKFEVAKEIVRSIEAICKLT